MVPQYLRNRSFFCWTCRVILLFVGSISFGGGALSSNSRLFASAGAGVGESVEEVEIQAGKAARFAPQGINGTPQRLGSAKKGKLCRP